MNISFVDLRKQNRIHNKEFLAAITKIIKNAEFIQGKTLNRFEDEFAEYCGKKFCVGLNSGTDALLFGLLAYGIGAGDEVITVPNSYFSTAMVIHSTGARAVFVDIDPETRIIDPQKIEPKITQKTKAVIPVHLYGHPADMKSIVEIAEKYNLHIIEDCCQAHGSSYYGKKVPFTDTGAFSFYPGKNLGSFGDAGALVTDDAHIARLTRLLRNDGSSIKYKHLMFGYKSRLDTIQAAILLTKLRYLDTWNELRRRHAQTYSSLLDSVPQIKLPIEHKYAKHVYHIYSIEALQRNRLQKYLENRGIATVIHYPIPIHLQKPFRLLGYKIGDYPITETKSKNILSLPMYPEITETEIEYIARAIKTFYRSQR